MIPWRVDTSAPCIDVHTFSQEHSVWCCSGQPLMCKITTLGVLPAKVNTSGSMMSNIAPPIWPSTAQHCPTRAVRQLTYFDGCPGLPCLPACPNEYPPTWPPRAVWGSRHPLMVNLVPCAQQLPKQYQWKLDVPHCSTHLAKCHPGQSLSLDTL